MDLGVLDADHASLTVSSLLSNSTPQQRQAFTRALLRQVFVEDAHQAPETFHP